MKACRSGTKIIAVHSISHMAVDFICILSLMHSFGNDALMIVLYNFCAFALQLPAGLMLDLLVKDRNDKQRIPLYAAVSGMMLCMIGSFSTPLISGIGNALFHTGAGMICMEQDEVNYLKGRGLGVFVAPGALGVTGGILLTSTEWFSIVRIVLCALLALLCLIALSMHRHAEISRKPVSQSLHTDDLRISFLCLAAVILRSIAGTSLVFSWRNGVIYIILSTLALAAGKAAGGFLSARLNVKKASVMSLVLAAAFYLVSDHPFFGLCALFFFNMTMPLTLYIEMKNHPDMHGFAFGLLTFGLFLGWLPAFYGICKNVNAPLPGAVISILSMILLVSAEALRKRNS